MTSSPSTPSSEQLGLVGVLALVACCAVPMLLILGTTSILGASIGWASALALGAVAASACVVLMMRRHGRHGVDHCHGGEHDHA